MMRDCTDLRTGFAITVSVIVIGVCLGYPGTGIPWDRGTGIPVFRTSGTPAMGNGPMRLR